MKPEILFLGDSHTIALEEGARALGMKTDAVRYGGSGWSDGKLGWNADGFVPKGSPMGVRALEAVRERLGVKNVFSLGIPVVTTAGFHLGRLIRPFDWYDHRVMGASDTAFDSGLVVSDAMAEAYVAHFRQPHLRLLRRVARLAPVVAMAPPQLEQDRNFWPVRALVIRLMRQAGITVFDPNAVLFGEETVLPAHLIEEDGQHASAEYGLLAMKALRDSGWPG